MWKRAKLRDEDDVDALVEVNGAALKLQRAGPIDVQSFAHCKGARDLQERAEAAPSPVFAHKSSTATAWKVGSLGTLLLAIVLPVAEGGPLYAPTEPQAATTGWINLLPQDVVAHVDTHVNPCDDLYAFSCGS